MPEDIGTAIRNALAILATPGAKAPHAIERNFQLAVETLLAARAAIEKRDSEIDLVTDPDHTAAEEAQRLRAALEKAEGRILELEQELAMAKHDAEVEQVLHAEEQKRLKTAEKKAKDLDSLLMEDDEAFKRYMDKAMDEQERKGKGPGRRR